MRILQVTNGFPPQASAGVELHSLHLSQALSVRNAVAVFCREADLRRPEFSLRMDAWQGLPVWRVTNNLIEAPTLDRLDRQPAIDAHFRTVVREWRPDVVHFQHCLGLSADLPLIAREMGLPAVLTLHDYWYQCPTVNLLTSRLTLCPGAHHGPNCFECVRLSDPRLAGLRRSGLYGLARRLPAPILSAAAGAAEAVLGPSRRPPQPGSPPAPAAPGQAAAIADRAALMRRVLEAPQLLTAPSRYVRDRYVDFGVDPGRIRLLPLGIDASALPGPGRPRTARPDGLHFAFLGTLLEAKGPLVLLDAFGTLPGAGHRLSLYGAQVPGAGDFNRRLQARLRAEPRAAWRGPYQQAQDLARILGEIDVLIVPSLWHETYSFVVREALLAGVWVIASAVGAIPEVVQPGRNGWLVPPGDAGALAAALARTVEAWPPAVEPPADPIAPPSPAEYADAAEALYLEAARASRPAG